MKSQNHTQPVEISNGRKTSQNHGTGRNQQNQKNHNNHTKPVDIGNNRRKPQQSHECDRSRQQTQKARKSHTKPHGIALKSHRASPN